MHLSPGRRAYHVGEDPTKQDVVVYKDHYYYCRDGYEMKYMQKMCLKGLMATTGRYCTEGLKSIPYTSRFVVFMTAFISIIDCLLTTSWTVAVMSSRSNFGKCVETKKLFTLILLSSK